MNRFLGLSGLFHIALVAGLFYLGAKNDFSPHKVIESLSFESFGGENGGAHAELKASAEEAAESTEVTPISQQSQPEESVAQAETKTATLPVKAKAVKSAEKTEVKKAAVIKPTPAKSAKDSKSAKTENPQIETAQVEDSSNVELDESVVEEAITAVKQSSNQQEEKASVSQEAAALATEEIADHDEESQAMAAAHEQEIQKQNEADAKAEEEAARAKKVALLNDLRKQNAEREAQEAALAAAAANSGLGSKNQGEGPKEGEEVRAVSELKQIGGNPKPQYDNEDRMKGRSGTVVFQAFVQNDGKLKDFTMLESSGHRTLDSKTLKALKQWKFAAGQEGWIEIPFKWDLKGGAQEISPLRNAVTK